MAGIAQRLPETEADVEFDENRVVHTYTLNFQVEADTKDEDEDAILVADNLPYVGLSVYGNRGAVCKNKRVVRVDENRKYWTVAADFDTRPNETQNNEQDQPSDPTAYEIEEEWSSEKLIIYKDKDLDDKPFQNSAEEPFEGGLPIELAIPVLTLTRFEPSFDPNLIITYENHTNQTVFFGAKPGQALCAEIKAKRTIGVDTTPWRLVYVFKFHLHDEKGWKTVEKLNQGTYYVDSGDGNKKKRFMTDGDPANNAPPVPRKGLLDSDGDIVGTTPSYEEFRIKDEAEFNDLNFT